MTAPGGGYSVNPGDLHRHASQRRMESADFITDKPPEAPGDPDDPTTEASGDLTADVYGASHSLHDKSHHTADKVDAAGEAYSAQDQDSKGHLGGLNNGELAKGVDAQGIGAVMNPFFQLAGQGLSASGTLAGQGMSAVASFAGQGMSAGSGLISGMAKNMGVGSAVSGGLPLTPAGGMAGAASGGDEGSTAPAAATTPLASPSGSSSLPGDHVRTESQDREEHTVMPASMGGGGMPMAGMAAGAGSSSPTARVQKATVVYGNNPQTDPAPEVQETPVAYAPSPLTKEDSHGTHT